MKTAMKAEMKGGHDARECTATPDSRYCSERCGLDSKAGAGRVLACNCGHPGCGAEKK